MSNENVRREVVSIVEEMILNSKELEKMRFDRLGRFSAEIKYVQDKLSSNNVNNFYYSWETEDESLDGVKILFTETLSYEKDTGKISYYFSEDDEEVILLGASLEVRARCSTRFDRFLGEGLTDQINMIALAE